MALITEISRKNHTSAVELEEKGKIKEKLAEVVTRRFVECRKRPGGYMWSDSLFFFFLSFIMNPN